MDKEQAEDSTSWIIKQGEDLNREARWKSMASSSRP